MDIKLRDVQPGQRFSFAGQSCVRIAHADSVGLMDADRETVWFYNLEDNTVNYAALNTDFEFLLDMTVQLHPFDEGYGAYMNNLPNPYNETTEDFRQFNLGWTKSYQDDFDYSYGKHCGGL